MVLKVRSKSVIYYLHPNSGGGVSFLLGLYNPQNYRRTFLGEGEWCLLGGVVGEDECEVKGMFREVFEESASCVLLENRECITHTHKFIKKGESIYIHYVLLDSKNYVSSCDYDTKRSHFKEKHFLEMKKLKWVSLQEFKELLLEREVDNIKMYERDRLFVLNSLPEKMKSFILGEE